MKDEYIIGWLSLYLEYEQKDTAYLSVFYIREAYRKNGLGSEVIEAITQILLVKQYKIIRLHCSLRDATALRFWVKNGFNKIINVECDGNLFPENFGGLELMKSITISE
jgi:GNAT superfamily N-acetyltransferase